MSTNRRKPIKVDEEKLKMMMAGDIPIKADPHNDVIEIDELPRKREKKQQKDSKDILIKEENKTTESEDSEPSKSSSDTGRAVKRRKGKKSYKEAFLCKPVSSSRRQSTILFDDTNYNNIMKVIKTVDGISISNFINNLLTDHFLEYEEEIMEQKRDYINNLYD